MLRKPSFTSAQIRAARSLIRWTAEDLASASALSVATIRRAELKEIETTLTTANDLAIRRAFEAVGIEFIDENGGEPRGALTKAAKKEGLGRSGHSVWVAQLRPTGVAREPQPRHAPAGRLHNEPISRPSFLRSLLRPDITSIAGSLLIRGRSNAGLGVHDRPEESLRGAAGV